ncbi:hypothetical protein CTA1_12104 [Colletotrichum tanaceti]|uniref:Uncharacterized protein n=1 Tax=Colletotrichum tanaceti TaxID=1306861 RepID=A0A4U6XR51_9PEZI|nr:hypothetical protein CTA1_12104 [Colletotrichum tanaceti]
MPAYPTSKHKQQCHAYDKSSVATLASEVYAPEVKLDHAAFFKPEGLNSHHPNNSCTAVANVFASLVRDAVVRVTVIRGRGP